MSAEKLGARCFRKTSRAFSFPGFPTLNAAVQARIYRVRGSAYHTAADLHLPEAGLDTAWASTLRSDSMSVTSSTRVTWARSQALGKGRSVTWTAVGAAPEGALREQRAPGHREGPTGMPDWRGAGGTRTAACVQQGCVAGVPGREPGFQIRARQGSHQEGAEQKSEGIPAESADEGTWRTRMAAPGPCLS